VQYVVRKVSNISQQMNAGCVWRIKHDIGQARMLDVNQIYKYLEVVSTLQNSVLIIWS